MKASFSLFMTSALVIGALGAASPAFGSPRQRENSDTSARHAASGHRSHSSSHHRSSGSHHSTNSGSKTHSNVPSN